MHLVGPYKVIFPCGKPKVLIRHTPVIWAVGFFLSAVAAIVWLVSHVVFSFRSVMVRLPAGSTCRVVQGYGREALDEQHGAAPAPVSPALIIVLMAVILLVRTVVLHPMAVRLFLLREAATPRSTVESDCHSRTQCGVCWQAAPAPAGHTPLCCAHDLGGHQHHLSRQHHAVSVSLVPVMSHDRCRMRVVGSGWGQQSPGSDRKGFFLFLSGRALGELATGAGFGAAAAA